MIILAQILVVLGLICFVGMFVPALCQAVKNGLAGDAFELGWAGFTICMMLLLVGFLVAHWPYLWDMP